VAAGRRAAPVPVLVRSRVIAALTRGTVVVGASARSGARQTCGRARLLGRATMAVPGPVISAMSVGTHQILRTLEGRLVTNAAEVIEEVGTIGDDLAPPARGEENDRDRLGATLARVLDGVPARPGAGPEQIAASAGVALRIALRALPALEAAGFVQRDDSGWRLARPGEAGHAQLSTRDRAGSQSRCNRRTPTAPKILPRGPP